MEFDYDAQVTCLQSDVNGKLLVEGRLGLNHISSIHIPATLTASGALKGLP